MRRTAADISIEPGKKILTPSGGTPLLAKERGKG
jgi:hypothetical protein